MKKIDWRRKLSSRKFWAMVAGLATGVVILITRNDGLASEIGGFVLSFGSLAVYMLAEGMADAAHKEDEDE